MQKQKNRHETGQMLDWSRKVCVIAVRGQAAKVSIQRRPKKMHKAHWLYSERD
jgi:hypothetical protein